VEEMRNEENPAEPKNRKSKTAQKKDSFFNFFSVIGAKPTLHFIRKRTTTNVILTNTHDAQLLVLFLDCIILLFQNQSKGIELNKIRRKYAATLPRFHFAILNISI
jgi:hypothetical protein